MKISELIRRLEAFKERYSDFEIDKKVNRGHLEVEFTTDQGEKLCTVVNRFFDEAFCDETYDKNGNQKMPVRLPKQEPKGQNNEI